MQDLQIYDDINFMRIFTHRKLLIILITTVTIALAVAFSKQRESNYTATATLIISFDNPSNNNSVLPAMLQEEYLATQISIASGNFMAEQVYNASNFDTDPLFEEIRVFYEAQGINIEDAKPLIREWLLAGLRVYVHNKSTRLMKIAFTNKDINIATKVANTFADQYLNTALELNLAPIRSSAKWIDENAKPIYETLGKAEEILALGVSEEATNQIENLLYAALSGLNNLESMMNRPSTDARVERNSQYLVQVRSSLLSANQKLIEKSRTVGVRHIEYEAATQEVRYLQDVFLSEVKKQIESIKVAIESLRQSLVLRGNVKESNVKLLNYSNVEIEFDEIRVEKAAIYGAILGLMLGFIIAFFSIIGKPSRFIEELSTAVYE